MSQKITKICTVCLVEKPRTDFHVKSLATGKLRGYCKKCQSEKFKAYYSATRTQRLQNKKEYSNRTRNSLEHIKMRLLDMSKKRAKKSGIEHSITLKDIDAPEYCPVLGIKLASNEGGVPLANSYSLDKIQNEKGYTPGNVKVISYRANSIKSDGSFEEHIKVAKYINSNKSFLQKIKNAFQAFWMLLA